MCTNQEMQENEMKINGIYDEEYFEQRDDFMLNDENETHSTLNFCDDYIVPTIKGFDYLITEYQSVPGYYLLPHGVIYAKSIKAKTGKSQIFNMINYFLSFFAINAANNDFLEPRLYVLKKQYQ